MALTGDTLNSLADHLGTLIGEASLHTADPGSTGANESTATRQAVAWTAAATGDISFTAAENFTGGTASGPCTHFGLWSADGLTFRGGGALTGDQTFNAAGEYTLNDVTINGSTS